MNQEIDKSLFNNLAQIIEQGKQQVVAQVKQCADAYLLACGQEDK